MESTLGCASKAQELLDSWWNQSEFVIPGLTWLPLVRFVVMFPIYSIVTYFSHHRWFTHPFWRLRVAAHGHISPVASAAAVGHDGGRYQADAGQHHGRRHLPVDHGSDHCRQDLTSSKRSYQWKGFKVGKWWIYVVVTCCNQQHIGYNMVWRFNFIQFMSLILTSYLTRTPFNTQIPAFYGTHIRPWARRINSYKYLKGDEHPFIIL